MVFPLYIFLIAYFLFLILWFIFSMVAIYHMFRYGFKNFATFFVTFVFVVVSILLLFFSFTYVSQIEWGMNVSILKNVFGGSKIY